MSKLQVVVGGQFGSEGKGAIAGYLAGRHKPDRLLAIRVGGPNAGHTVMGRCPPSCTHTEHRLARDQWRPTGDSQADLESGKAVFLNHPWRLRQIPVAAVTAPGSMLMVAAGSEIDPSVLLNEIEALDAAGYKVSSRLVISKEATIITPDHAIQERSLVGRVGSTGKGIGAARSERIMRRAPRAGESSQLQGLCTDTGLIVRSYQRSDSLRILIEGTQGYGLGLHAGYYPYCTSGDCTAIDFLAQAQASPWLSKVEIWVVYRTFPIRVAGNSGPMRHETTWEQVGQPEELTTVTQKVRRVGEWDRKLARAAAVANGAGNGHGNAQMALTMMDYVFPAARECTSIDKLDDTTRYLLTERITRYEADTGLHCRLVGTGPDHVIDLHDEDRIPVPVTARNHDEEYPEDDPAA